MFSGRNLFSSHSSFAALRGVEQELSRGGDVRHKKNDGPSPIWKCPKCAKKHSSELGCGEPDVWVVEGEVIPDPSDTSYWLVQDTSDVDAVLDGHRHASFEEQMGCSKCKEGQRRKKRRAMEVAAMTAQARSNPYNMMGSFPVMNMTHFHMGQGDQMVSCPLQPAALDPTLNCMRDARGNAVCSNGLYYPPGCPHTPPDSYFTPGVTPDETVNGIIQGKIPPPRDAGSGSAPGAPSGGISTGTAIAAGAGALGVGALLFALFRK